MMDFEQFTEGRRLSPQDKKKEDDLIKAISDIEMEDDDFDKFMRRAHQARKKKAR